MRVTFIIENINHIHLAAKQPNTANKQLSPLSPGQSAPFESRIGRADRVAVDVGRCLFVFCGNSAAGFTIKTNKFIANKIANK